VMLRYVADDANSGSIVEAAIDDIEILDIESNVSVQDLRVNISAGIYPNPANSIVSLDFHLSSSVNGSLEIIGSLGQVVYSQNAQWSAGSNHISIDTRNFANGIYRVLLRSEGIQTILPLSVLHD